MGGIARFNYNRIEKFACFYHIPSFWSIILSMKILEVVNSLGIGGTERTAVNFSIGLTNKGCDVIVFSLNSGIRERELDSHHIPVIIGLERLKLLSIQWTPDIIHVHNHGIDSHIQREVCELYPNSYVCEQNVFGVPSNYSKLDCSFQLSKWSQWNYVNRKIKINYRIEILPNPINSENFYPASFSERNAFRNKYNIPLDSTVLLRIGQPIVAKWNVKMIDVFIDLKKKYANLFLLCIGAPQNIIDYSKKRNVYSNLLFIDKITNDKDLRVCYSSCDIFLHMARIGESFGIVLLEAMLCGTPIVTVNTPYCDNAQSEVVGHMVGGIVANRYKGILHAVSKLIEDKQLRAELAIKGRESAISRYELEYVTNYLLSYIKEKNNAQSKYSIELKDVRAYLSDAIDKPIPFAANIFILKKYFLSFLPERVFRYMVRCYCRFFDKSVQL